MKVGDLVMRKASWEWQRQNPWMKNTDMFDTGVGIVVNECTKTNQITGVVKACSVLWSDGTFYKFYRTRKLKVLVESR